MDGGRLVYYDFGMMGTIPSDIREGLLDLFYGVYQKDPDLYVSRLAYLCLQLSDGRLSDTYRHLTPCMRMPASEGPKAKLGKKQEASAMCLIQGQSAIYDIKSIYILSLSYITILYSYFFFNFPVRVNTHCI